MHRPCNVLVLELLQLAGPTCPYDQVVGWTALPVCGEDSSMIEGRFKLPVLRGDHSPAISQFRDMEATLRSDLSHWLCNAYLEIKRWDLAQWEEHQSCPAQQVQSDNRWQPLKLNPILPPFPSPSTILEYSNAPHSIGEVDSIKVENRREEADVEVAPSRDAGKRDIRAKPRLRPQPRPTISFSTSHTTRVHPDSPGESTDLEIGRELPPKRKSKRVSFQIPGQYRDDRPPSFVLPSDDDSSYNIHDSDSSTTTSEPPRRLARSVSSRHLKTRTRRKESFDDSSSGSFGDDEDDDRDSVHSADPNHSPSLKSSQNNLVMGKVSDVEGADDFKLVTEDADNFSKRWSRLVLPADIALYSPALVSDPAKLRRLLPDSVART